jgi:hypothetical protein
VLVEQVAAVLGPLSLQPMEVFTPVVVVVVPVETGQMTLLEEMVELESWFCHGVRHSR